MKPVSLFNDISSTTYPGRGIVIGRSADGTNTSLWAEAKTAETEFLLKPRTE